jgi:NADH-quinone oxidoreductase subunit E
MAKEIFTQENLDALAVSIEKHKSQPGPLMPTLHDAQKIFDCVPLKIQKIISKELGVSVSRINGVVTFYSQFSLEPKGDYVVGVCLGTACYVRGAQDILSAISNDLGIDVGKTSDDYKFTLEATRCIGACGLAPVFTVNEDVYGNISIADSKKAIQKYM